MIVTRNQLVASGPIDRDDLNALGDIQVALETSDYNAIVAQVEGALGNGIAGLNYLRNADFSLWTRGQGPLSLAGGIWSELADYWYAQPSYAALGSGGAGTYAQYSLSADAVHQPWLYGAKLTGCDGLNYLDFGQRIPARIAASLHPTCTLTVEIENQTGAALTPSVRLETCNTFESWTAATLRVSAALTAIANAAVSIQTITLDLSAYGAELDNGALIHLRFPAIGVGGYVRIFTSKLEFGGTATARTTERNTDPISAPATGGGGVGGAVLAEQINYFANPNFHRWQTTSRTCQEDQTNWGPLGWFARPSDGADLLMQRATLSPDVGSKFSAQLVGAVGCTGTVDFGTEIDLPTASEARAQLVFSAKVRNNTGTAISPELRIDTCDSENSFGLAVTNRVSQILGPCASSGWTTLSFAVDTATLANFQLGAVFYLRFAAGDLNEATKTIEIARPRLEPGAVATTLTPTPHYDEPIAVAGAYATLRVAYASSTTISIAASEVVLKDASGKSLLIPSFGATLSVATSGPNGIDYAQPPTPSTTHYLWLISNATATAALLTKTASASPALPSGYMYRAWVGAVRLTPLAQFPRFLQHGKRVYLPWVNVLSGVPSAGNTWQTLSLVNVVPDIAVAAGGNCGVSTDHAVRMRIAADAPAVFADPALGENVFCFRRTTNSFNFRGAALRVPIHTAPNIYWAVDNNAPTFRIDIDRYTLP